MTDSIQKIQDSEVMKQVLKDSFGGIMYNVANRDKYDSERILAIWDNMTPAEKESVGG